MSGAWLDPDLVTAATAKAILSAKKKDKKQLDALFFLALAVDDVVPNNSKNYRVFVSATDFLLIKDFFNREEPI